MDSNIENILISEEVLITDPNTSQLTPISNNSATKGVKYPALANS